MYIVPIAWIYVALLMSVAEATNSNGTVLGALVTFVVYGLLPVGLVLYIMGTPGRKRQLRAKAAQEQADWEARSASSAAEAPLPDVPATPASSDAPDASRHAPADPIAPMRKEA